MCESFGMQLDDDHLLALFSVYDPDGTGYLAYMDLVKHLMHPDTFCYYVGSVDNSQKAADGTWVKTLMGMVGRKFAPVVEELVPVLRAFDDNGTGYLFRNDLLAGCAALGVIVSETEFESMMPVLKTNSAGQIDYVHLCSLFTAA
jgi:Ca2+-binding EF-hand superfamily protein